MKNWFISGVSSGLGRALAEHLLRCGDSVAGTSRNLDNLKVLTEQFPDQFLPLQMDLQDFASISSAWRTAQERFKEIHVLVNNAGAGLIGALEDTSQEQLRQSFDINYFGPLHLMQNALPHFRESRRGHIIVVSAIPALCNEPGFSVYGAAKAALDSTSQSLASELRPLGIHVSIVIPGPFRTPFISQSMTFSSPSAPYVANVGQFQNLLRKIDGKQPGNPERAAAAIEQLTKEDHPQLRLILGKYALDKMSKQIAKLSSDLEISKPVGVAADNW